MGVGAGGSRRLALSECDRRGSHRTKVHALLECEHARKVTGSRGPVKMKFFTPVFAMHKWAQGGARWTGAFWRACTLPGSPATLRGPLTTAFYAQPIPDREGLARSKKPGQEDKFIFFLYKNRSLLCTIATRTSHGRRYATHLQRLWAGFYVHRC